MVIVEIAEAPVAVVGNVFFTQRMINNLIFLQVTQGYSFQTIQRLFKVSHNVEVNYDDIVEVITRCGYGWSLWKKPDPKVIWIDGQGFNKEMCDHIVFMHSNRQLQWSTLAKLFFLTHGVMLTSRMIVKVLELHDYAVNGLVHRQKQPIKPVIARAPPPIETQQPLDEYYQKAACWQKERHLVIDPVSREPQPSLLLPRIRYNWGMYTPGDIPVR